ncbi:MAG: hypothetical protein ACXW27_07610 [Allosphingosinicella sp.]
MPGADDSAPGPAATPPAGASPDTADSFRAGQFVLALLLLVGLFIPFLVPSHAPDRILEWLPQAAAQQAERSLGIARTGADGPPMVWVRFDDDSLNADKAPATPRAPIADLLERMLRRPATFPDLVFLDIAIAQPGGDPAGDARLLAAIAAWNEVPEAPPLAIYAGRSCTAPGQPVGAAGDSDPTIFFDPGIYRDVVPLRASGATAKTRIAWSCPTFIGLRQTEYSCVTTTPLARSPNRTYKWALPSPAWFAASARASRSDFHSFMRSDLEAADKICRGVDPDETGMRRPHLSRVSLAYNDLGGAAGLARRTAAGGQRPLLSVVPIGKLLGQPDSDLGALGGAIVVIGTGNSWFPDIIHTEAGDVPGSIIVAAALREAFLFGLSEPVAPSAQALMIFFGLLLAALIFRVLLPLARRSAMAWSWVRRPILPFLILHEQVIVLLVFAFLFWMPGLLPVRLTLVVVVVAVLTEFMLLADFMRQDWKREKVAN